MGVKAGDVGNSGFRGPSLQSPIVGNNSWSFNSTGSCPHSMDEPSNQGHIDNDKYTGSMNLEELLQNMSNAEIEHPTFSMQVDSIESSALPLRRQGSLLANCVTRSKKTSDEIWKEIQQGEEVTKNCTVVKTEKDLMTLEDFLAKTQASSEGEDSFVSSAVYEDQINASRSFSAHVNLSPAPSIGALSDSPLTGCKRGAYDSTDPVDRKLKRKIKNRESAARSRARKQAYHNELVSKVSCLELENFKLKKEKEFDQLFSRLDEKKYQLRRTSSTSF